MKRTPAEGRYSRVSRRMWGDEKFRALSKPKPNAQTLWFRLLTGSELGCIPGLFEAREAGLADALEWPLAAFRRCWKEIADQGMALADWRAGIVWLPKGIVHDPPASPNVVKSWRLAWLELPESSVKDQARQHLEAHLAAMGEPWLNAFREALGEPSGKPPPKPPDKPSRKAFAKPSPNPSRNQIQNPEQDQDPKAADADPSLTRGARDELPSGVRQQQRRPRNLEEALALEPSARARMVLESPYDGDWLQPQFWPEVMAVAKALEQASGRKVLPLGGYSRDSGLRAVVGLLADGYELDALVRVAKTLPKSDWWRSGNRGLASLTPEVVRRAIDEHPPGLDAHEQRRVQAARMRGRKAREDLERASTAVGEIGGTGGR